MDEKSPIYILFISSDPVDADHLSTDKEYREIYGEYQKWEFQERFKLVPILAARPIDICRELAQIGNEVGQNAGRKFFVHFALHFSFGGNPVAQDNFDQKWEINKEDLASLFEIISKDIFCVLLNGCFSQTAAEDIGKSIYYVVGVDERIDDDAGIAFSRGFYQKLFAGSSIEDAYKWGLAQPEVNKLDVKFKPILSGLAIREKMTDIYPPARLLQIVASDQDSPPRPQMVDRDDEKQRIQNFVNCLRDPKRHPTYQRLLWLWGPAGIGKGKLIEWLRFEAAQAPAINIQHDLSLGNAPLNTIFGILAGVTPDHVAGLSPPEIQDALCANLLSKLCGSSQPKLIILDTDYTFRDFEGLTAFLHILSRKVGSAPHVGFVIATRRQPMTLLPALEVPPLKPEDLGKMAALNDRQVTLEELEVVKAKAGGNPLFATFLHAYLLLNEGAQERLAGFTNMSTLLPRFFEALGASEPTQKHLLEHLALALTAPGEQGEKTILRSTFLSSFPPSEQIIYNNALSELLKMGVVEERGLALWLHGEIVAHVNIGATLPAEVRQDHHFALANALREKDPLGALWHYVKADRVEDVIVLIAQAEEYARNQLQALRFLQIFKVAVIFFNTLLERTASEDEDHARAFAMLGFIHTSLAGIEDTAANCRAAIRAYEAALQVYTCDRLPMDYAMTQNNLGNALRTLAGVEDTAANCRAAIRAFEAALQVYTCDRLPMDYAMTQNNLGVALHTLAGVVDTAANCRAAIRAYEAALQVRTRDCFPMDYAMTQNNLGNALRTLAGVVDTAVNCQAAIRAYEAALQVRTQDRFPIQFASTQNNLGNAFRTLAGVVDTAANCRAAIRAYEAALQVFTLATYPLQYKEIFGKLKRVKRNIRD